MSIETMRVIDFQWNVGTLGDNEIYKEIRQLWSDNRLPNDVAYIKWNVELMGDKYPRIKEYLNTLPQDVPFLLHWWW